MKWYFRRTLDRVLCPFSQHLSVFFSAVVSQIQILGQRIVCHRKQHVCTYFQQAASYCSGQRASSMWRKFPPVCSNYCLQRIAVPPEKRRGREKETKKKRLHSENNYFVPNCHSAPANKNFPSQRKMFGKVSAKRCIWDLAFKQVSCNISNSMNYRLWYIWSMTSGMKWIEALIFSFWMRVHYHIGIL